MLGSNDKDARSDRDLVLAARAGDRQSFAELVVRYEDLVRRLGYAHTGQAAETEEICQDAFVVAWRQLATLREPDHFRRWLCGITMNLVRRSAKAARTSARPFLDGAASAEALSSGDPSPVERMIEREEARALTKALARLSETYRMPLVLYYRDELSIEEVADALGISMQAVRNRLHRGRKMLHGPMLVALQARAGVRPAWRSGLATAVLAAIAGQSAKGAEAAPAGLGKMRRLVTVRTAALTAVVAGVAGVGLGTAARRSPQARAAESDDDRPAHRGIVGTAAPALGGTRPSPSRPGLESEKVAAPATLWSFDFEDGVTSDVFPLGFVTESGPGASSRFAIKSTVLLDAPEAQIAVGALYGESGRTPPPLFHHSATTVIAFDYRIDDPAPLRWEADRNLKLQLRDDDQRANFYLTGKVIVGRWAHAEIRAVDFLETGTRRAFGLKPGDAIRHIRFFAGTARGTGFQLDNLKISIHAEADFPAQSQWQLPAR